jgi:hypothetical protein
VSHSTYTTQTQHTRTSHLQHSSDRMCLCLDTGWSTAACVYPNCVVWCPAPTPAAAERTGD